MGLGMAMMLVALLFASSPALASVGPQPSAPDDYLKDMELLKVQALLAEKGFYRGQVSGWSTPESEQAILAFHKATDQERTSVWEPGDFALLSAWEAEVPELPDHPDRLEIDIERQVMYLVEGGEVVATFGISSGSGEIYLSPRPEVGWAIATTPLGSFAIERHIPGWRFVGLGVLYNPWYFDGPYAIHGSPSVPAYPASHGCVRTTYTDADWLTERLSIGFRVIVRDVIPRSDPQVSLVNRSFFDRPGMYS